MTRSANVVCRSNSHSCLLLIVAVIMFPKLRSFVEYEPHGYWANKAAALYMHARPTYGLESMPINDEMEHLVLKDVFLTAYVMGRQEARRNWYNKNPDGYRKDVMKHGNDACMRAMEDNETI